MEGSEKKPLRLNNVSNKYLVPAIEKMLIANPTKTSSAPKLKLKTPNKIAVSTPADTPQIKPVRALPE